VVELGWDDVHGWAGMGGTQIGTTRLVLFVTVTYYLPCVSDQQLHFIVGIMLSWQEFVNSTTDVARTVGESCPH